MLSSFFRHPLRPGLSLLAALALVLGLAFAIDKRAPAQAADGAQPSRAPAPYVSSDPSLPPAAGVKLPDATPHIEAF